MSTPFYDLASLVVVPSGYKASKVYAQKPLTTDGQLTFSRASTATRVTSTGALETVSSNVPRLDYTNSSCPKLLLEPQRTQKLLGSNTFTNVYWTLNGQGIASAPVITANYGTDPFGGNNAWRIQLNLNGGTDSSARSWILQSFNPSATVTLSMYIKLNTAGTKTVVLSDSAGHTVSLNSTSWTRISQTVSGGSGEFRFGLIGGGTSDTLDASICYAQCEEGSYPTSIIVSTTATVTRLADACSKTGISSLIGQTEGTLFFDVPAQNFRAENYQTLFLIYNNAGLANKYFHLYKNTGNTYLFFEVFNGTTQASISYLISQNTRYKIAAVYKNNRFELWVNGSLVSSDYVGTIATNVYDTMQMAYDSFNSNSQMICSQAMLFKTALTTAQLAELTAL